MSFLYMRTNKQKTKKRIIKTRKTRKPNKKQYSPKDFSCLLGNVEGINDKLLTTHFKLYEGLVGATNDALKQIKTTKDLVILTGLQKQLSFFFNGMRLHELYFGVLKKDTKNKNKKSDKLTKAINNSFGSFDAWKKDFCKTGTIPGVGFVCLVKDRTTNKLLNVWVNEFNIGELIDTDILLVMDMWEHAFLCEFGLDIAKYQETFLNNVNWHTVSKRI